MELWSLCKIFANYEIQNPDHVSAAIWVHCEDVPICRYEGVIWPGPIVAISLIERRALANSRLGAGGGGLYGNLVLDSGGLAAGAARRRRRGQERWVSCGEQSSGSCR